MIFDAPNATQSCTCRIQSSRPLQTLTLLNDDTFYEFARALTARVLTEAPADDAARIILAFRFCLARSPSEVESKRLTDLLNHQARRLPGRSRIGQGNRPTRFGPGPPRTSGVDRPGARH